MRAELEAQIQTLQNCQRIELIRAVAEEVDRALAAESGRYDALEKKAMAFVRIVGISVTLVIAFVSVILPPVSRIGGVLAAVLVSLAFLAAALYGLLIVYWSLVALRLRQYPAIDEHTLFCIEENSSELEYRRAVLLAKIDNLDDFYRSNDDKAACVQRSVQSFFYFLALALVLCVTSVVGMVWA